MARACAREVKGIMGREGLTQTKLAAELDRSQAYISDRLNFKAAFDLDDIEGLARLIREDPFTLLLQIAELARDREHKQTTKGRAFREREQVAERAKKIPTRRPTGRKRSQSG